MNEATDILTGDSFFLCSLWVVGSQSWMNMFHRAMDDNSRKRGSERLEMTFDWRSTFGGWKPDPIRLHSFTSQWSVFYSVIPFILSQPRSPWGSISKLVLLCGAKKHWGTEYFKPKKEEERAKVNFKFEKGNGWDTDKNNVWCARPGEVNGTRDLFRSPSRDVTRRRFFIR